MKQELPRQRRPVQRPQPDRHDSSLPERNNPFQLSPRQRIELESTRLGAPALAQACANLLHGDYRDTRLITLLGGATARWALDRDRHDWYRVWAARGLLWCWDDCALAAIQAATRDDAWRVRELAAKVIARHLLGDALPAIDALRTDPVPRVRTAATRAITRLTQAGA